METTPRKGISKGCLVGLIVGVALVVILITFIVLVYVFRGSLVKAGAAATIREVKTLLAKAPPDGVDTVQFNSLADAFVERVNQEKDEQFEALSGVMTQMYGVVKDKQVTREEAMTTCAAIISLYPDLEQYWIPKQEDVTTQFKIVSAANRLPGPAQAGVSTSSADGDVNMISILTALVAAYLIGAIPFGLLIARISGVKDIRDTGSGNIGATNVLRSLGMKVAIWVYICDIGKGALTVFLAPLLSQNLLEPDVYWVLVGLATILGHIFPVYLHFKGGKGVAAMFGVLLVLLPIETLLAGLVFLLIVWWTRYVSLASIAAGLTFPIAVTIERTLLNQGGSNVLWGLTFFIGLLVPITHIPNIKRLIAGTENKFERSSPKGAVRG